MTDADLVARYDGRVPRYTSYPTAPHFSAAVDGARYKQWLAAIPPDAPLSIYLHVPFCEELCLYCGCNASVVRQTAPRLVYADALCHEIRMVADAIGHRPRVTHIHWGGGTPTALPAVSLRAIMDLLRSRFDIAADAEIAIELDPRHLPADRLAAFPAMGVNRVSLGVQDFEPAVQQAIHRIQSFETTQDVATQVRAHGITSLNLDLMYGLPLQTTESVAATARQALALNPDRIAVFGYAHVPWMKRHQALLPEGQLPGTLERFAQLQAVERVLREAGYTAIGLDHYARPDDSLARAAAEGTMRRNFQGYTTDDAPTLLAFGASAIGALPQGYAQNAAKTPAYIAAIRAGGLPVERGLALTADDRFRADIIQHIMCEGHVDLPAIAEAHGSDTACLAAAAPRLNDLAHDGLIHWTGTQIDVVPAGRPFVRAVAAAFDAYLTTGGAAAHARAI